MGRFWVFPPLFAGLFLGFQLSLLWMESVLSAILLPLMLSKTDVYLHTPSFDFRQYIPITALGAGAGLIFAALDFALHPEDPRGAEALRHLCRFWRLMTAALGVGLANNLILQFGTRYWDLRRRYHAYSPDFQILDLLSSLTPMVFLIVVGWAIIATLRRARHPAN